MMKDFKSYKQKFQDIQKTAKQNLKNIKSDVDLTQQQLISQLNSQSEKIQLLIDEMAEVLNEISKLSLGSSDRQIHVKLKTEHNQLQSDFQQARKKIREQIKAQQKLCHVARNDGVSNRLKSLDYESQRLDMTIALSASVIDQASSQSELIHNQTQRLKNTNKNLGQIQTSSIPGAEKLMGMIGRAELKNKIILSFVIALCLSLLLHSLGVTKLLKEIIKFKQ